ncbi:MAG: imelysin family protein [Taibaiella sp.]|jgi:predicted lipoprotein
MMTRKHWMATGTLILLMIAGFVSCKKSDDKGSGDNGLDRKPMLTNYADNYILPAYQAMETGLTTLQAQATAFTEQPTEANLSSLKATWRSAYLTWQTVDLLEFGPAEEVSLRMYMNTYPVTTTKVEENISSGNYNLETFGNKDAQGFPALDYLINGLGNTSASILEKYTTDPLAANYKKYLKDVIAKMQEKITSVKNSWTNYRNTFISAAGTDVNGSISKMTNAYVLYYERFLRSGKIGYPVGAMTGVALPTHVEAYYTPEFSKELAVKALESVIAFYEGKNYDGTVTTEGMKSYLAAVGTKDESGTLMADVISTEFNTALNALKGFNTTFRDGVVNNRPAILGIYENLQQVVALLKVDMVSAFGISITYVDNDGD